MHEKSGWIVWNFDYKPPYFENKDLALSVKFSVFANVYHVTSTKKGHKSFLKCDCHLYERCGTPCSHILKITDRVEATMIKIQHWKVFHVYFGLAESKISAQLMHGISIQLIDEDMGIPISDDCLIKANSPDTSWYVIFRVVYRFSIFGWYSVGIFWYYQYQYQRISRSVLSVLRTYKKYVIYSKSYTTPRYF